ncbi:MAG: hypothetical protein H7Y18_19035 [Clostridiaceae bacterium]|nr:hypothetical protein [Clostridiaceae bacterium]
MKALISNYIKMLKIGFYLKTLLYSLLLILPSVVKGLFNVGSEFYETTYIIMLGFAIISVGLSEVSEKRYVFCLTLPVNTKDIIKIAYIHTYIIYILGFLGSLLVSILSHQKLPGLYLLIIVLYLLSTNFLYPSFASSELKVRADQQEDSAVWAVLVLASMIFIALASILAINKFGYNVVFYCELLAIVLCSILVAFTFNKSYELTLMKVMGFHN